MGDRRYRWDALIDRVPKNKKIRVAEVGVWRGGLSLKLLEALPKIKLVQVDRWKTYSDEEIEAEGNSRMSRYPQEKFDIAFKENIENIKPYSKRVRTIQLDSVEAADRFPDKTFYVVFLDAAHQYEKFKADILAWLPKVRPGGWIGGHDYPGRPGVKKAVDEIFGDRVETDVNKTWWVKR
jgi:predicted O-methyltransferase YrrM